jgi:hypothetical protein
MAANSNMFYDDGSYINRVPQQPVYCDSCQINTEIKTIPNNFPYVRTIWGPTSLKHLYTGIPNYYPYQTITRPYNSMYGQDLSQYDVYGMRLSYGHNQLDPFFHHHAREVGHYTKTPTGKQFLSTPDIRTMMRYPVANEGTLNR